MSDDREPLLDAMLEELLGGQSPPDLKQQILHAHGTEPIVRERKPVAIDKHGFPTIVARPRRNHRRNHPRSHRSRSWNGWVAVVMVLIAASTFFAWFLHQRGRHLANLQDRPGAQPRENLEPVPVPRPVPPEVAQAVPSETIVDRAGPPIESTLPERVTPFFDPSLIDNQTSPKFQREFALETGWDDERIIEFTDQQLAAKWKEADLDVAKEVSAGAWFTRAYEFLLGKRPPRSEVQNFVRRNLDRGGAINVLLHRPEFVAKWSVELADMLVGQFPPDNKAFKRDQLEAYLRDAIAHDKPYDELTFELITAVGSNDQDRKDFNPAVNFLLAHQGVPAGRTTNRLHKKVDATNIVCQVFLGKQLQCAQCHVHPVTGWDQDQYWQMASFFVQMRKVPLGSASAQLLDFDFTGQRGNPNRAELVYETSNAATRAAFPVFIDGRSPASQSGVPSELNRREALAKLIVSSDAFSKTAVNRLWDKVFGEGFTYPVDDLGAHNLPTHPELLDRLATEFRNSGFQFRSALRWMTLSTVFRLEATQHAKLFNAYAKPASPAYQPIARALTKLAQNARRGITELAQTDDQGITPEKIQEGYERFHAKDRDKLLDASPGSLLARIANNAQLSDRDKVEHLFLSILGRRPVARELNQGRVLLENSPSDESALQEIGMILLHSKEFGVQH